MDSARMQQQVIPQDALRLPDLRLMVGPWELEFEIELPKNCEWNLKGDNTLAVSSSDGTTLAVDGASFQPHSMRFMVPVKALRSGEVALTYDIALAWQGKDGTQCRDNRQVVQRVSIDTARGATVPWVHYKAQALAGDPEGCRGPVEE